MANKIKDLTNIISDGTIEKEIKCGIIALKSEMYEQAWNHLIKAYNSKEATKEEKGEAGYQICSLMKDIPSSDPLIKKLMETDKDLIRLIKTKPVTKEYAKKYIGRKYLRMAAEYGYSAALIEYGLACVNFGKENDFVFEYNKENEEAAFAWANIMKKHSNEYVRQAAHIIYAKCYFVKAIDSNTPSIINSFGDNVIQAESIDTNSQYVKFFKAHLNANPKFKDYKNGQYFNIKEGYDKFCLLASTASDPSVKKSAIELKNLFDKKYHSALKK